MPRLRTDRYQNPAQRLTQLPPVDAPFHGGGTHPGNLGVTLIIERGRRLWVPGGLLYFM